MIVFKQVFQTCLPLFGQTDCPAPNSCLLKFILPLTEINISIHHSYQIKSSCRFKYGYLCEHFRQFEWTLTKYLLPYRLLMKVTIKCYRILHTKAKPVIYFIATFSSLKHGNSVIIYPKSVWLSSAKHIKEIFWKMSVLHNESQWGSKLTRYTGLEHKWWRNCPFCVNHPFKCVYKSAIIYRFFFCLSDFLRLTIISYSLSIPSWSPSPMMAQAGWTW